MYLSLIYFQKPLIYQFAILRVYLYLLYFLGIRKRKYHSHKDNNSL